MGFEDEIARAGLFGQRSEKTFIDKLLARDEVAAVREIMKKERLNRADVMDLLNLLSGNEIKLVNYSSWERHVMAKYFVWSREFIKACEFLYDYKSYLEKEAHAGRITLSKDALKMYDNALLLSEHNIKFLCDLYYNLARSSMSLEAVGIMELLKNKFEISYPEAKVAVDTAPRK